MARRLAIASLFVSLCLLLFPTPSGAHNSSTPTNVQAGRTLGNNRATIFGDVQNTEPDCIAGEQVKLRRVGGGVLDTDTTDGDGEYRFRIQRPENDSFKVFVRYPASTDTSYGHSHGCQSDDSRDLNIKKKD